MVIEMTLQAWEAEESAIRSKVKVGDTYHIDYGNQNDRIIHIRAIVDRQYVIRSWNRHRLGWSYDIVPWYYFESRAKRIREWK